MEFSIKNLFSKCGQIRSFLRIWPHLLKKSLMENFILCAVETEIIVSLDPKYVLYWVKKLRKQALSKSSNAVYPRKRKPSSRFMRP